jgi:hypothetical protein
MKPRAIYIYMGALKWQAKQRYCYWLSLSLSLSLSLYIYIYIYIVRVIHVRTEVKNKNKKVNAIKVFLKKLFNYLH